MSFPCSAKASDNAVVSVCRGLDSGSVNKHARSCRASPRRCTSRPAVFMRACERVWACVCVCGSRHAAAVVCSRLKSFRPRRLQAGALDGEEGCMCVCAAEERRSLYARCV